MSIEAKKIEYKKNIYNKVRGLFDRAYGDVILIHTSSVPTETPGKKISDKPERQKIDINRTVVRWGYIAPTIYDLPQLIFCWGSHTFNLYGDVEIETQEGMEGEEMVHIKDQYNHEVIFPIREEY